MTAKYSALLIAGLLMLPSCGDKQNQAAYWETEREIVDLTQQLKLAEYRLSHSPGQGHGDNIESIREAIAQYKNQIKSLNSSQIALTDEVSNLEKQVNDYVRDAIRTVRADAMGKKFDSFSTADGRIFSNVMITAVDDSGVAIRHAHGSARLRYADLTERQRVQFGLEQETSIAAEEQERQQQIAYEQSMKAELEAKQEKEERLAAVASSDARRYNSNSYIARTTTPSSESSSTLSQPAKTFGSGSIYRSYYRDTYRTYRPRYGYTYYYPSSSGYYPRRVDKDMIRSGMFPQ